MVFNYYFICSVHNAFYINNKLPMAKQSRERHFLCFDKYSFHIKSSNPQSIFHKYIKFYIYKRYLKFHTKYLNGYVSYKKAFIIKK